MLRTVQNSPVKSKSAGSLLASTDFTFLSLHDNFRFADDPGGIAWWLEPKCRVRLYR